MKTTRGWGGAAALIVLAIAVGGGQRAGAAITFAGSGLSNNDGTALAASAQFALVGGDLQITIANTAGSATSDAANVLTAMFFDVNGAGALSVAQEYIPSGNTVFDDTSSTKLTANLALPGTVLGKSVDQWEYATMPPLAGLGSAGLNFFNGNMVSKDGLVSPNYVPTDGLKHDGQAVFQNSIIILLQEYGGDLSDISNVRFQYGTAVTDTSLTGSQILSVVPEANFALGSVALLLPLALAMLFRKSGRTDQRMMEQQFNA